MRKDFQALLRCIYRIDYFDKLRMIEALPIVVNGERYGQVLQRLQSNKANEENEAMERVWKTWGIQWGIL